jgi:hypothetical protein
MPHADPRAESVHLEASLIRTAAGLGRWTPNSASRDCANGRAGLTTGARRLTRLSANRQQARQQPG